MAGCSSTNRATTPRVEPASEASGSVTGGSDRGQTLDLLGKVCPRFAHHPNGNRRKHLVPLVCFFDGGCGPNNPGGHAGCGAIVTDGQREIFTKSHYVGYGSEMSNNVAEYEGICLVFEYLLKSEATHAIVRGDSQMVIKQLQGRMKARKGLYVPHFKRAMDLYRKLQSNGVEIKLEWITREENFRADYLAGQAIKNAPRGNQRNQELVRLVKAQQADARIDQIAIKGLR